MKYFLIFILALLNSPSHVMSAGGACCGFGFSTKLFNDIDRIDETELTNLSSEQQKEGQGLSQKQDEVDEGSSQELNESDPAAIVTQPDAVATARHERPSEQTANNPFENFNIFEQCLLACCPSLNEVPQPKLNEATEYNPGAYHTCCVNLCGECCYTGGSAYDHLWKEVTNTEISRE